MVYLLRGRCNGIEWEHSVKEADLGWDLKLSLFFFFLFMWRVWCCIMSEEALHRPGRGVAVTRSHTSRVRTRWAGWNDRLERKHERKKNSSKERRALIFTSFHSKRLLLIEWLWRFRIIMFFLIIIIALCFMLPLEWNSSEKLLRKVLQTIWVLSKKIRHSQNPLLCPLKAF